MATAKEVKDFEEVIERIVFKEVELDELKIAIRSFNQGTITSKQLKQTLISCRGRIAKDLSNFLIYCLDKAQESGQAQIGSNFTDSNQSDLVNDQLRQEIADKNELLEVVARRISALASKAKKAPSVAGKSLGLEKAIRTEIERVFLAVKVNEWLDMCGYDDYKFFVKLYPKLEGLYSERFGESEKSSNNAKNGKDIMANKMVRLGFPEEIETIVIQYVVIRNIFQHSMEDISPSNLEQAREVFVEVLVYLIISSLEPKLVSKDRESFYSCLNEFFSKRLARNPIFRKRMLERLKTVFYS
jgi:exonuclease VII small subunit